MHEIDKAKFGAFVARLRKERSCTQKELGEMLMVSDKAVSKWETGATVPDTAMLLPLADALGVTVTELLNGERAESCPLPSGTPETDAPKRVWSEKSPCKRLYVLGCVFEIICLFFLYRGGQLTEGVAVTAVLAAFIGAYFCFFAPTDLPKHYDNNKTDTVSDRAVELRVRGLCFSNRNWRHIVAVCRASMVAEMTALPLLALAAVNLNSALWIAAEKYITLILLLAGLFAPMYFIGKKYE